MKNNIKGFQLLMLILLLLCGSSKGQLADYAQNKEKIYIQTNHVFFKPGEELFFKIYLVNAKNNFISVLSNVVYVEIIGPSGSIVEKQNYHIEDGYAEGSFQFGEEVPGGMYKIRAYSNWMQNEKENTWFTKEITVQSVLAPRVLMKLEFPEKGYGPGDEVTAAYAIRDLGDRPIPGYSAKYTVSIQGQTIITDAVRTDSRGKAAIRFKLPADLNSSDGLLNVTVNVDGYTEAISRSIPIIVNKIDLQFMPEGGTFIAGIPANVAFKAINEFGKPADVKGLIKDELNNTITSFESTHDGMGQVAFTPQEGRSYRAVLLKPAGVVQHFDLPAVSRQGLVMHIRRKEKLLQVSITTTRDIDIRLVAQSKNDVHYYKELSLQKGTQVVEIDPATFPTGIARFTITTATRIPLAERIVFLHADRILNVKITTDKERYQPREKVTLHLKTVDETGQPVASNFSLTVIDDKLWSLADDKQDHILSWLLMSSELHGKIEEPQFYFRQDKKAAASSLDLVMLTHGYRYFDYIDHVERTGQPKFGADLSNILSGVIADINDKPVKSTVYLIRSFDKNNTAASKIIKQETGEDGKFFFTDITPAANYYIMARSVNKKEHVYIRGVMQGAEYIPTPAKKLKDPFADDRLPAPLMADVNKNIDKGLNGFFALDIPKQDVMEWAKDADRKLEEVVVIGYGTQRKQQLAGAVTTVNSQEIVTNVSNMLYGRVAGLEIKTNQLYNSDEFHIRGSQSISNSNQPLILLDGIPVDKLSDAINPADIVSITILKDASATALYGSQGANGVILITSRKENYPSTIINLEPTYYYTSKAIQLKQDRYTVTKGFYAPKYLSPETQVRDDFRETIYWNPVVQTDNKGDATVEFYNSDANTTFRAIAEGIGYNGKLGRSEKTYSVKSPLMVDAKIPPYMTTGDVVRIPLVIRNNTEKAVTAKVLALLPYNVTQEPHPDSVSVPADSSVQVLITVKAKSAVKGNFEFIVTADKRREFISLPVKIVSNGFPVITTLSGNKSSETKFTVDHMMEGTLATELKVFNKIEDRLLSDIESMLREPYGCFEQTSSTTYPNIYILRFLRNSGNRNLTVENKAMDYLKAGYKRLIGFETAQNGFEWFGRTPPHEALTAYGLLEFTAMSEFLHVDKQMLARTKKFLLSRRDGKGNFQIHKQGLDAFASVPDHIAGCYIVYALTAAGVKTEIQKEYNTAVKQAMESKDAYLSSMMALAAHHMGQLNDFNQLLSAAKQAKLQSATSVTNSRNTSLRVETIALYALALMKEQTPDMGAIADLITGIMKEKKYYGYGSTQATVLALQAIVEYQKIIGDKIAASQMEIKVNNKTVFLGSQPQSAVDNIRDGNNVFSIRYKDENINAPYQLELAYYTSLPPTDPQAELKISTSLSDSSTRVGETVRMQVKVTNTKDILQPMSIAKVGIPAGLTVQPWQLKEILEQEKIAYYEIFDNYLVLYWMGFAPGETKTVNFDLKAEIGGNYKGKASTVYLYYTPEFKHWISGTAITIE
ncbi:TonB-dependent receptor plug domain-containing protein [Chitinophaga agri]|uniref:TonB-dependent receptor plug domain-containing protein n=1 Tax=Chitinophaga agri TaxID=2703787 RepID=A0A6B9ZLJ4_9BACT|nr:alpha-2-macroglobulin family protein [Chitinophaga agri]QHS63300.1 TonB-dependent receptor plug domain-containing protein [Chitinophaga agri]